MFDAFTDYPFTDLGDAEFKKAPIRKVKIIGHDRNKYVDIIVFFQDSDGDDRALVTNIKAGYVYKNESRYEGGELFSHDELCQLPWTY